MLSRLLLCLFLCSAGQITAQELVRKGFLGVQMRPVDGQTGVQVMRVFPESTAQNIGIQKSDILLQINQQVIQQSQDVGAAIGTLRAGDPIEVLVSRNEEELKLSGKVVGKALETSTSSEVIYGSIPYKSGWLRTIVNKPLTPGKHPTIFFIPGYTCATVDNLPEYHPYRKLIDSLSGLGYAIFRVEKPGIGDNLNTGDCQQLGFDNELEAYFTAYDHLSKYDCFDPENIYLLGHSMGGVYAPVIGAAKKPKGIIVYGTVHEGWVEYLLRMVRFQNPRFGNDYVETHEDLQTLYALLYEHYYLGKSSKTLAQNPDYQKILERDFAFDGEDQILYRHEDFWREINDHNLTKGWAESPSYVLSIFGEADIEAVNDYAHKEIVQICNHYKPNTASFHLMEATDHSMIKVGTMEEGAAMRGSRAYFDLMQNAFNFEVVTLIDDWIQATKVLSFPEEIPEQ